VAPSGHSLFHQACSIPPSIWDVFFLFSTSVKFPNCFHTSVVQKKNGCFSCSISGFSFADWNQCHSLSPDLFPSDQRWVHLYYSLLIFSTVFVELMKAPLPFTCHRLNRVIPNGPSPQFLVYCHAPLIEWSAPILINFFFPINPPFLGFTRSCFKWLLFFFIHPFPPSYLWMFTSDPFSHLIFFFSVCGGVWSNFFIDLFPRQGFWEFFFSRPVVSSWKTVLILMLSVYFLCYVAVVLTLLDALSLLKCVSGFC